MLGPLWQFLETAVWIAGLTLIFSSKGIHYSTQLLHTASGVILWGLISQSLIGGTTIFPRNATFISNVQIPLAFCAYRQIVRQVARFLFQAPVFIILHVYFRLPLDWTLLAAVVGFGILLYTSFWVILLMGIAAARWRDLQFAVSAAMRFLFFMSPVFWIPIPGTLRAEVARYNPFTYYLEIVRAPLLGQWPSVEALAVVGIITGCLTLVTWGLFHFYRNKIALWL